MVQIQKLLDTMHVQLATPGELVQPPRSSQLPGHDKKWLAQIRHSRNQSKRHSDIKQVKIRSAIPASGLVDASSKCDWRWSHKSTKIAKHHSPAHHSSAHQS
jgi:hypothetical protein